MAQPARPFKMKTHKNLYSKIYSMKNLVLAWKKARKGKTKRHYVIQFEENLLGNLLDLHYELKYQIYKPKFLKTFILRDPKTRKISKSDFRDRVVHHALIRVIEPIFDKIFICDSCANRKGRGNLFAIKRFHKFIKKVSKNGKLIKNPYGNNSIIGYCLKSDIKHYFQEVDHEILIKIIRRKIKDEKVIWLVQEILENNVHGNPIGKGMPLGNLTSQFFANVYLNELDIFAKHYLRTRFYIRYVDDFLILYHYKEKLRIWKEKISGFLRMALRLELHPEKSRIISLSKGIDFVGFRNFYYPRLLRKRNIRSVKAKILLFAKREISEEKILEIFQGWRAYARWANTYKLRLEMFYKITKLHNSI
jgi:retron-type reverse transcriptase